MTDVSPAADADPSDLEEQAAPACVMSFNVNDPSGAADRPETSRRSRRWERTPCR
jgi:hypothetical protein